MLEMMNSVSVHIQRAISDAINNQVMPQIQNALNAGLGHVAQKRWIVPVQRPEYNAKDYRHEKNRSNVRSELSRNRVQDEHTGQAYDMVTGDNESQIQVPEILPGRLPSRTHLNQSHDDLNPLLDTTIPTQERTPPAAEIDPTIRLAVVLTSMLNRPTAQQPTISCSTKCWNN